MQQGLHAYNLPTKIGVLYSFLKDQIHLPSLRGLSGRRNITAEFNSQNEILDKSSLLSVSDLKGNITYVNDKFCEVSKYGREELLGKPHSIVRHPDTSSETFKEMWRVIGSGKVWQGELQNLAKDGSSYWVCATVSPVLGQNGKPVKYISMRQDITKQKLLSEELNQTKSRIDSDLYENVNYAKRIHKTFLSSEKMLSSISPESFLVYKAQKIVSGDFYMFEKRDQQSVIIMGDSTGHGVSASYISLMILNILNRVLKFSFYCPATVLEMLHLEILSTTSLNNANPIIECADMGMCFIDHEKMTMEYALARGKGIILRDGKVIQLEREKCSVGAQECNEIKLKRNVINLLKGDQLYLYSDGITDQFGGPFGKKIGNKKLLEILKSNSSFSMETQKNFILKELASWQGNYEQTDDISLIGLKII